MMSSTDILASLEQATRETVETVYRGYVAAGLWSSIDDNEEPLDANYTADDLSSSASKAMLVDCLSFLQACWDCGLYVEYDGLIHVSS